MGLNRAKSVVPAKGEVSIEGGIRGSSRLKVIGSCSTTATPSKKEYSEVALKQVGSWDI